MDHLNVNFFKMSLVMTKSDHSLDGSMDFGLQNIWSLTSKKEL